MDKELVSGSLGSVGKWDVAFKDGSLVAEMDANVAIGSAGIVLKISAKAVLDAIAAKIPGQLDDAIIKMLESGLGV